MPKNESYQRGQGFAEEAAKKSVSTEWDEREPAAAPAGRHLTPLEQRVFNAALRRSVKVISSGASRSKQS